MSPELTQIAKQYIKELRYRDSGIASAATYKKIKELATPEELIDILEKYGAPSSLWENSQR